MDEQLARIVIGNAARAAREVSNLSPLLDDHSDPATCHEIKNGIGTVIHEIYGSILEPVFGRFPQLKDEFERNVERYGSGC
jgi:hypothetical protein